jgi:hypothetical protein
VVLSFSSYVIGGGFGGGGNPTLESAVRRRLSSIIWEKKNSRVPVLEVINPLEESAHILVSKMRSRLRCGEKCF